MSETPGRGGRHRRRGFLRPTDTAAECAEPDEMPGSAGAAAALLHGDDNSRGLAYPAGWRAGEAGVLSVRLSADPPPPRDEEAQARAALYAARPVRPGGIAPGWGCSSSAHEHLGWCAQCKGIDLAAEVMAWRVLGDGLPAPDAAWAKLVAGQDPKP